MAVTSTMAMIEPGSSRWILGANTMTVATTSTIPSAHAACGQVTVGSASIAATSAFVLGPGAVPSAAGTCCRKMMTAIPRVNPSMTGHGMYVTARPRCSTPAATTMIPASRPTVARAPTPFVAMIGPSTTTMAPVGPDTCTFEPPNTAAITPAMIAVTRPLSAPAPELTPNASARGRATMPTVTPAMRSPFQVRGTSR